MNRLEALYKLDDLVEKHCNSCAIPYNKRDRYCLDECEVGKKMQVLGDQLLQREKKHKKIQRILDKGQDMTKNDIELLLQFEVRKQDIQKALGMADNSFNEMMLNFGFSKKRKREEKQVPLDLSVPEFAELHIVQGKKVPEVAEIKGLDPQQVYNWKRYKKDEIEKAISNLNQEQKEENLLETKKCTPKPINRTEVELQEMVNDLSTKLDIATKENQSLKEQAKEREYLHAAFDDSENEIDSLRNELKESQEENKHLKALLKMYL